MICDCYKLSTHYFEIDFNYYILIKMLVCGSWLVFNNFYIKRIYGKIQKYFPVPGIYTFMAECYEARKNSMCEVSFYDDIEDDDVDEERLENYFNDYSFLNYDNELFLFLI